MFFLILKCFLFTFTDIFTGTYICGLNWKLYVWKLLKTNAKQIIMTSQYKSLKLKAQQSLPGQRVKGEGLWLNSLDYLLVCYTQCSILTVLYVVCYQSVTRNSNNISGYVYNIEYITQPTPISHSPRQIQILNLTVGFFPQTHISGGVIKIFSDYN